MSLPGRSAILGGPAGDAPGRPQGQSGRYDAGPAWMRIVPPAVTLAVMLWRITLPSYWRDEGATLSAVQRPFGDLIRMLGNVDAVHGAYYMIIWLAVRLGGSGELVTRLPSALAMAAAAAGVAAIGRRLVSPRAGLLAGLVLATLPEISFYGQDARSFALVTALATGASYLLIRVLCADGSRRGWLVAYAACLAGLGLANIFGLALIPAHGLTVALTARRTAGRPARWSLAGGWMAACASAVAVTSPVVALAWQQRGQDGWLRPPGFRNVRDLQYLIGPQALIVVLLLIIVCGVVFSLLPGEAKLRADWPASQLVLCVPWLLLPPAVLLTASLIHPVYTLRYILFVLPALALLTGTALAALGRATGTIALILVVLTAFPAQIDVRHRGAHGDDIRMADSIIRAARHPGDAVLYADPDGRNMAAAYPYGLPELRNIGLKQAPISSGTLAGTYLPAAAVRQRLAGVRRVWVIEIPKRSGLVRLPVLRGLHFRLVRMWRPEGIWMMLYQHPARPGR